MIATLFLYIIIGYQGNSQSSCWEFLNFSTRGYHKKPNSVNEHRGNGKFWTSRRPITLYGLWQTKIFWQTTPKYVLNSQSLKVSVFYAFFIFDGNTFIWRQLDYKVAEKLQNTWICRDFERPYTYLECVIGIVVPSIIKLRNMETSLFLGKLFINNNLCWI